MNDWKPEWDHLQAAHDTSTLAARVIVHRGACRCGRGPDLLVGKRQWRKFMRTAPRAAR